MVLCACFNTNLWSNACFKFLMRITYSFLSYKFATSSSTVSVFILSDKKSKSFWKLCKFHGLHINIKKMSFTTFIILALYEIFIKFRNIFNPFKVTYRELLWRGLTIKTIYIPIFKVWLFFIFIIMYFYHNVSNVCY